MQMKEGGFNSATVLAINKFQVQALECFVNFLIIVDSISPLSQKLTIPLLLLEVTFIHLIPVSRGIIFSVISIIVGCYHFLYENMVLIPCFRIKMITVYSN